MGLDDTPAVPTLRIATMPGVIVSKWTRVLAERRPDVPVELVRTDTASQVSVLHDDLADVSFVRLPVDRTGLSVVPLYTEVAVVVVPVDHVLTLLDEVPQTDLDEEPRVPEQVSVADTIALVAAGLGVTVVPMSVARMHHRKDLTHRPVAGLEGTGVAVAWLADRTTPGIEEFVGIVRGRTERSSRAPGPDGATAQDGGPSTTAPATNAGAGKTKDPTRSRGTDGGKAGATGKDAAAGKDGAARQDRREANARRAAARRPGRPGGPGRPARRRGSR